MNPSLAGVRVIEFEGLGLGPLAGKMLCDVGAAVTVITRPQKGALDEESTAHAADREYVNAGQLPSMEYR